MGSPIDGEGAGFTIYANEVFYIIMVEKIKSNCIISTHSSIIIRNNKDADDADDADDAGRSFCVCVCVLIIIEYIVGRGTRPKSIVLWK